MYIDTEHLHYWMQAIRKSKNHQRTLDAFWKGQISSKEWLINSLEKFIYDPVSIEIHGGWVGVLSSLIFQSNIPASKILSIDIDQTCKNIAKEMNMLEVMEGRFDVIAKDMCDHVPQSDVIINTSCEHMIQQDYNRWLDNTNDQLLVLQSNNYDIEEHVRIAHDLTEFKKQSNIEIFWSGELELPLYTRYMLIGKKK